MFLFLFLEDLFFVGPEGVMGRDGAQPKDVPHLWAAPLMGQDRWGKTHGAGQILSNVSSLKRTY